MTRKKPKREWVPRVAPPPPSAADVEKKFLDVIEGRVAFEDADEWAMQWVAADNAGIEDDNIWQAVCHLAGCSERHGPDEPYLFTRETFEEWLADFRAGLSR
jgi:hypothetical protein